MTFATQLNALVAAELASAAGNADRMGVVIERLLYGAALAIAVAARGRPEAIDEFVTGADSYLHETAVSLAPLAQMTARP